MNQAQQRYVNVFLGPFPGLVSDHSFCWACSFNSTTWYPSYCGIKPLINEYGALKVKHADLAEELDYIERDLGWLKDIRRQVDEVLDRQEREQRERGREQNKGQKPTSVLEQKMMEAKQRLREQRESKKKRREEMER